jgi:hypothetical protein
MTWLNMYGHYLLNGNGSSLLMHIPSPTLDFGIKYF